MDTKDKLVYVPMAVDTVHPGHMNILKVAARLGRVMVGLFSDEAIASYKQAPLMNYEQRKSVIENIKGVDIVVKQATRDYEPNLRQYQPAYMVHGTDWRNGPLSDVREKAINLMQQWGGEVIEPEYTTGISSSMLKNEMTKKGISPQSRQGVLRQRLHLKAYTYISGVLDTFSAFIQENVEVDDPRKAKNRIHALLVEEQELPSLLSHDLLSMGPSRYLSKINEIAAVTTLPLLATDRLFRTQQEYIWALKELQRLGVSAFILTDLGQATDFGLSIDEKLAIFRERRSSVDFLAIPELSIAKVEQDVDKAVNQVFMYAEQGADAVCINGIARPSENLKEFCQSVNKISKIDLFAIVYPGFTVTGIKELDFQAVLCRQLGVQAIGICMKNETEKFLQTE